MLDVSPYTLSGHLLTGRLVSRLTGLTCLSGWFVKKKKHSHIKKMKSISKLQTGAYVINGKVSLKKNKKQKKPSSTLLPPRGPTGLFSLQPCHQASLPQTRRGGIPTHFFPPREWRITNNCQTNKEKCSSFWETAKRLQCMSEHFCSGDLDC